MPNIKVKGTYKPNSHWCRPSDSQRPYLQRPPHLSKIQNEKFDPLYQCCVRNADTSILGSDSGYAGTELLLILKKKMSKFLKEFPSFHNLPDTSNTTSSETQISAFSKIPDKSLELELHQYVYT